MKYHQRLVRDTPQRYQSPAIRPIGHPALNESDIDADRRTFKQLKIFQRAAGGKNLQGHAVARQYLAVFDRVGLE